MNLFRYIASLFALLLAQSLAGQMLRLPDPVRSSGDGLRCGGSEAQQLLFERQPERAKKQAELDDQLYRLSSAPQPAQKGAAAQTLPVVFHIIHNNGIENLPDDRIQAALDQVNDAFAHAGYFSSAGDGYDTGIRFCLA
ncbi:MAG TPA: hypothetical protein PKL15_04520, partial [Saprospiraceae bacterium]|nr:hypothetical protein [Saprospiraceae bacterium]